MGRVIPDSTKTGDYHPMVGLRTLGNFVKGTVKEIGKTTNGNPVVTLALIDLDGSTSKSVSKGVYEEVEVKIGDLVQIIGSVKQLREKLPQLNIGDVATVTFTATKPLPKGKKMYEFKVEVE